MCGEQKLSARKREEDLRSSHDLKAQLFAHTQDLQALLPPLKEGLQVFGNQNIEFENGGEAGRELRETMTETPKEQQAVTYRASRGSQREEQAGQDDAGSLQEVRRELLIATTRLAHMEQHVNLLTERLEASTASAANSPGLLMHLPPTSGGISGKASMPAGMPARFSTSLPNAEEGGGMWASGARDRLDVLEKSHSNVEVVLKRRVAHLERLLLTQFEAQIVDEAAARRDLSADACNAHVAHLQLRARTALLEHQRGRSAEEGRRAGTAGSSQLSIKGHTSEVWRQENANGAAVGEVAEVADLLLEVLDAPNATILVGQVAGQVAGHARRSIEHGGGGGGGGGDKRKQPREPREIQMKLEVRKCRVIFACIAS